MIRKSWWKVLSVVFLLFTFTAGFLIKVPHIGNLYGSIRNFFFHVPMWFGMMVLFIVSVIYAIKFLRNPSIDADIYSREYAKTGIVFGVLGLITGAIWANYTWGEAWSNDPKQLLAAIALLIYAAYFILRNSIPDVDKRAKIGAVYNVFACAMLFPTLWIIPRMVESLHPGGQGVEGNPGMGGGKDLDPAMRMVFWPAVVGWTLLGVWITTLRIRLEQFKEKQSVNG
ncbi:cytochrome c biogenesis protein CcsA [Segetibacter koreensis]|uniref:cytochrome c biogenesis protein CcsA n=1 Tax=Segetibacter koreensis TaxID=398037 RepID=UPI00036F4DD7|nr:cytochrome c biogenesis protein CcsA [Segetibacter koreensis]